MLERKTTLQMRFRNHFSKISQMTKKSRASKAAKRRHQKDAAEFSMPRLVSGSSSEDFQSDDAESQYDSEDSEHAISESELAAVLGFAGDTSGSESPSRPWCPFSLNHNIFQ